MSRVEVISRELIVVHGLTVNYNQSPAEAVEGLDNNSSIATDFPQDKWNGGKSGVVEGVSIPLVCPRQWFSTSQGRQLVEDQKFGPPALPAEIVPLKEAAICQDLVNQGIWWVAAFCRGDDALWPDPAGGYLRVVSLYCSPRCPGFSLWWADDDWDGSFALAGSPQVGL